MITIIKKLLLLGDATKKRSHSWKSITDSHLSFPNFLLVISSVIFVHLFPIFDSVWRSDLWVPCNSSFWEHMLNYYLLLWIRKVATREKQARHFMALWLLLAVWSSSSTIFHHHRSSKQMQCNNKTYSRTPAIIFQRVVKRERETNKAIRSTNVQNTQSQSSPFIAYFLFELQSL